MMVGVCVPHTQLRFLYWVFFDLFCCACVGCPLHPRPRGAQPDVRQTVRWLSRRAVLHRRWSPAAAMHLMYYTNEEGHRVYTLKVPPSPALIVLRCSARGAAHAKRDQASAPLYAHICSLRRKRLRTAGRRNPRTLPVSRPMTNSPSSASSARSASACCRCSARRWPCELLRHVRRCAACPTGVHCDLPNTLSSSPCPCIRTVICDVSLLSRRKLDI